MDNNPQEATAARSDRSNHFFNHSHEGLVFHIDGIITDANPALAKIIGYTVDELTGSNVLQWVAPQHHELIKQKISNPNPDEEDYEISLIHKSGREIPVYLHPVQTLTVNGHNERLVAILEIQSLKQAQLIELQVKEQIHRLSNFDQHTGLPNRQLFSCWTEEMWESHHAEQQRFAIVHISIERIKILNEIFNRDIVDQLIKHWALRLCEMPDVITKHRSARIGGIHFAIAIPYIEDAKSVIYQLQKLRAKLERPYHIEDHEINNVSGSYGIAFFPDDGDNIETLMSRAEIACRHARENSNAKISCFSQEMNIHTLDKFKFETRLRGALDRDELALYYQPKVDTVTEQTIGYEALIRWLDPEKGVILPADFIPLAEETGLIIPIGEWVIWSACQQLAYLQELPGKTPKIGINLSSVQFKQSNLVKVVQQAIILLEIDPSLLDLELTESVVMNDVEASVETLNQLKALGVSISIDDFGTGYSSLSYLKRFPIDTLKVDRSFITDITTNPQDESITRTIITLAKSLNIKTIAEGVETNEQLAILRDMKCDLIQGFLFGKPLPASDVFS